jgi:serine/threonine protein kinase
MKTDLGIEGLSQVSEIGRGGSARVLSAYQPNLDRMVAVKVLHSAWDANVQRRFDRERRAMGRMSDHPGIVPIYETGETVAGEPYMVMPYYSKGSLADALVDGQPMAWQKASALIASISETISSAHRLGIIHCDIKPANVMIHSSGQPKVADFGISRTSGTDTTDHASSLTFTPAYSPPEVFTDSTRNETVDVYGLGATLFALLAGRPPFHRPGEKPDVMAIINRVAHQPIDDLRGWVPAPLCDFVERAMAKDPKDRPQDASSFLLGLKAAVREAKQSTQPNAPPLIGPNGPQIPLRSISVKRARNPRPVPKPARVPALRHPRLIGPSGIAAVFLTAVMIGGLLAIWRVDGRALTATATSTTSPPTTAAPTTQSPTTTGASTTSASELDESTTTQGSIRSTTPVEPIGSVVEPATGSVDKPDEPRAAPPLITSLAVNDLTETTATITFATNECADSEVIFTNSTASRSLKSSRCRKIHTYHLNILDPATSYQVTVRASVKGATTSGATSFRTPAVDEPMPLAAPIVSNLRLESIGQATAVMAFDTDICATSEVITILGSVVNGTCARSHVVEIGVDGNALTPGTRYVVLIAAKANGRTSTSSLSFTTLSTPAPPAPAPQILSIDVVAITQTTAKVVFTTDQCTGAEFAVSGFGSGEFGYPRVNECWTSHQIRLGTSPVTSDPLSPGTTYSVTVSARAQDGTNSPARTISFTTLAQDSPPTTQPNTTTTTAPTTSTTQPNTTTTQPTTTSSETTSPPTTQAITTPETTQPTTTTTTEAVPPVTEAEPP